jgi:hypothetical protein
MTIQFMPPGDSSHNPIVVAGRSYAAALGSVINVPDFDAPTLDSNGWLRCAGHGAGATIARPTTGLFKGFTFFDSTLNVNVIWDGKVWRSHVSGAAV